MRLTTLRVLAVTTTVLVAAAVSCLATFAQGSAPVAPSQALSSCVASALEIRDGGTQIAGSQATTKIVVTNTGEPCSLPRIPTVDAFDAAGNPVGLDPAKRIGVMRFVARPLPLAHAESASVTIQTSHDGTACAKIAKFAIAVGDRSLAIATDQTACTLPGGSNVSISFFKSDSANGGS